MTAWQNRVSFVVMAILIFILENLVLWGWVSTGPHVDVDLPFGWLHLTLYRHNWMVDHFDFRMLTVAALSSVLLTWLFSKALQKSVDRRLRPSSH
jgi:hypothetical protein